MLAIQINYNIKVTPKKSSMHHMEKEQQEEAKEIAEEKSKVIQQDLKIFSHDDNKSILKKIYLLNVYKFILSKS
jgi:beta-glucosidase-like glycosyl hydrolase